MKAKYLLYSLLFLHAIILLFLCLISEQNFTLNSIFCNDISNGNLNLIDNHILNEYYHDVETAKVDFEFSEDIFAILHIQKTSSFDWQSHMWENLEMKIESTNEWMKACLPWNTHYRCYKNDINKPILWSHEGNILCDIHADYTELMNCLIIEYKYRLPSLGTLMKGIVHFILFLRDPISRYINEYDEVKKGKNKNYNNQNLSIFGQIYY